MSEMPPIHQPTLRGTRGTDNYGSGQYGASRDGGRRAHAGLDFVALPGEQVFSPIDGVVYREAIPYAPFSGLAIRGTGAWNDVEVKLFYVEGLACGPVRAGDVIGHAQDLTGRYPGIKNHVHLEVMRNGRRIPPLEAFGACL